MQGGREEECKGEGGREAEERSECCCLWKGRAGLSAKAQGVFGTKHVADEAAGEGLRGRDKNKARESCCCLGPRSALPPTASRGCLAETGPKGKHTHVELGVLLLHPVFSTQDSSSGLLESSLGGQKHWGGCTVSSRDTHC